MPEILGACAAILLTLGLAWAITVPPRPAEKALAALALGLALLATTPLGYEAAGFAAYAFAVAKLCTMCVPLALLSWRPWSRERGAWLAASIGPLMMINIGEAVVIAASHGAVFNAAIGLGLILLQPIASTGRLVEDRVGPFHVWAHYGFTRWWIVAYTLWNLGFIEVFYVGLIGLGLPIAAIVACLLFPLVATWRRPERWLALRVYTLVAAILLRMMSGVLEEAGLGALNGLVLGADGMLVALCNLAALPLLVMLAAANAPGSLLAALRARFGRRAYPAARS